MMGIRFFRRVGFHLVTASMTAALLMVSGPVASAGGAGPRSKEAPKDDPVGRELFLKAWEPGTRSPMGGDGVGPLYNETSCVACHRLGGIGGGGSNGQNVTLLTAIASTAPTARGTEDFRGELAELHLGFRDVTSIVLHRHSTRSAEEKRLGEIASITRVDTHDRFFTLRTSARNTPPLFGTGRIDEIPEEVLLAAERRRHESFPEIRGRVSRLPDGRVGRFGWKGQTATLAEFVMAACANELGLEVPGHHQARLGPPTDSDPAPAGLDMDREQCRHLVGFVAALPPPRLLPIHEDRVAPWGYSVFERIGCAACHGARLGNINGIYSDLLLHDMGTSLSDAATYYGAPADSGSTGDLAEAREDARAARAPAVPSEWRTPPLWGVADSAPYLHDGRAGTLDEAIRLHDGEAAATVARYKKLALSDRAALIKFLQAMTASPRSRRAAAIDAIQARGRRQAATAPGRSPGRSGNPSRL